MTLEERLKLDTATIPVQNKPVPDAWALTVSGGIILAIIGALVLVVTALVGA